MSDALYRLLFRLPFRLPLVLLACCLTLGAVLSGCGSDAQSKETNEPEARAAFPVEVAAVEVGTASAYFTGTASLEAVDEATVVARVGGVVEQVLVEEGQAVRKGQALARLDDERLALEVRRTEVQLQKLESVFRRMETMHEKQLISNEEFEQARSDYEAQKVARDLAKLELEHATVRAPIGGLVSERMVKTGNMIGANAPAFRITGTDPLWAVLHVPERELQTLRAGQTALIRLDAVPGRTFSGTVARVSPVVDPETGTFRTVVEIRDPSRTAKPGMFGRVRVQYDSRDGARLVPKSALVEEDDVTSVFVLRDTIAVRQSVSTGYGDDQRIEITEGLDASDTVVVSGQTSLRDSARVEVVR